MKIIITILSIIIVGILFETYDKISQPEIKPIKKSFNTHTTEKKEEGVKLFFPKFQLPARELYMKIDFREYKNIILYKVTIKSNDEYAIFNIKAILDKEGIAYSVYEKKKTEIYILFKTLNQAENVINLFKSYHLNVKLQKIIKRI